MPNKTLYVREEDLPLWEAAERLAPDSVSALVSGLLRKHVATHLGGLETVEVNVSEKLRPVRITGRRIVIGKPIQPKGDFGNALRVDIWEGMKGRLVLFVYRGENLEEAIWSDYHVFESLEEIQKWGFEDCDNPGPAGEPTVWRIPKALLAQVASKFQLSAVELDV